MTSHEIHVMDCRLAMSLLIEPKSVHTVVTSPPYFGLRDYGHDGQIGLEPTPDEFVAKRTGRNSISCELNADYAAMARERIDAA